MCQFGPLCWMIIDGYFCVGLIFFFFSFWASWLVDLIVLGSWFNSWAGFVYLGPILEVVGLLKLLFDRLYL